MRLRGWLALAALLASGCARTITVEAEMPPLLLSGHKNVRVLAVGTFTTGGKTAPALAKSVADMLASEIDRSGWYELAENPRDAQLVISGQVSCRITSATAKLPPDLSDPERKARTVITRTAEVAVTFRAAAGSALTLFTVTERPTIQAKRNLEGRAPDTDTLQRALLRACVTAFVADMSPRTTRVGIRRPGPFSGRKRTRRGIDLLLTQPAAAIENLTKALRRDDKDAAAVNALGFCSEYAGNLEQAKRGYMYAASIDPREEYRENAERVHGLLQRRNSLFETGGRPR